MAVGFVWDDAKAEENFRKHGIDFKLARLAFSDAFNIDEIEDSMNYGERRFKLIGAAGSILITVIYPERGDWLRIISARRATRREHDRYFRENSEK